MDSRRKDKQKVQEISFILNNIFIIHPNASSKYKIRIIVNRNSKEQPFRKVSNRYIFRVPSNIEQMKGKVCYLVLLQKTKTNKGQGEYTQIGKGQIQLAQIIENRDLKKQSLVSGAIYGTRSYNYDKIIGKYAYKAMKSEGLAVKEKEQGIIKKNILDNQKKPPKQVPFAFQESIVKQNNEINNKIKELTNSMNKIINQQPLSQYQYDNDMFQNLSPIKEAIFEQCQFYYKYNAKIYDELNAGLKFKQFKTMIIRNIRIDSKQAQSQKLKMLDTIKVEKFQKTPTPPKKKLTGKIQQILIVCYQLLEQKRQRKRLLEIYTGISYNKDNRFLVDHIFYLPKTNNKMLFQVILVKYNNKERNFTGIAEPSAAKSRLIQLLDSQNKQNGIIICQLQECTEIDKGEIKGYLKQSEKFDKALRRYGDVSHFVKKIVPPPPFKDEPVKEVKLIDKNKDTLYSNFHDGEKPSPIKRKRFNTQLAHSSHLMNPSISRSKYSMSIDSDNNSISSSPRKGHKLLSKSIRAYPTESQSQVKLHKSLKKHRYIDQDFSGRYRLAIESFQISIYGKEIKNKKLLAKFQMDDQNTNKKIVLNSQSDWHPLDISFNNKSVNDSLMITLLLNKRNTTTYKNVGVTNILFSQLKNHGSNKYKAFISNDNKVVGFVILAFKVFREKEDDQKSQSFYYEQEFNRDIPLVNDQKKYLEEKFQDDSYIDFNQISEREKNKEQYNIDLESRHISAANNTQMNYISEKMSQGPPSEVLEDQDYNNGEPIRRRF